MPEPQNLTLIRHRQFKLRASDHVGKFVHRVVASHRPEAVVIERVFNGCGSFVFPKPKIQKDIRVNHRHGPRAPARCQSEVGFKRRPALRCRVVLLAQFQEKLRRGKRRGKGCHRCLTRFRCG